MGLDIKSVIQQKARWVAAKLSLRKLRTKMRSRRAMETTALRPVALAGASRGFVGSTTQCNHFARTPSGAQHEQWTDSSGGHGQQVAGLPDVPTQVLAAKSQSPVRRFLLTRLQVGLHARPRQCVAGHAQHNWRRKKTSLTLYYNYWKKSTHVQMLHFLVQLVGIRFQD
ncbi:hypothetical protein PF005_g30291 [Phytophthora fragariae]|uniref:Uncharacterized protein n=1 Tax=Phytophthora fragariae TaxID=53985 RepID=A0A6A3GZK9_9STRA|nr:hypothetical protein PF003_g27605 [Phytophthora fragariae]KAE8918855.1 hypothetical protein PF009_g30833 [Phytophthora fragariae]KAE8962616.1 hypothetical protein PF011_g29319 [Phytophthora fragariae]KAE9062116.1 hypothetical protein PF007_g30030 [Phytophthora fragariae]KAE9064807.1 hypothetical protein PF010_g28470 [Phytophthora fragariae]